MAGKRKQPQTRDKVLGAQLRAIRVGRTGFSLEQAAVAAKFSLATMSRTENGKRHITGEDVAVLCTVYDVSAVERAGLINAAKAPMQPGWWHQSEWSLIADALTLESQEMSAVAATDWSMAVVPGLLQTRDYAVGMFAAHGVDAAEDVEQIWSVRSRRQAMRSKIEYVAFMHEVALHTPYGGVVALKAQLEHLRQVAECGVGVRVVRVGSPLAALVHSWKLLEYRNDDPIVHVELMRSVVFLHAPAVSVYESARQELARTALSTAETRRMIEGVLDRL